ncbi:MAG: PH domain-containing protein [Sphingorhabdus sp.]
MNDAATSPVESRQEGERLHVLGLLVGFVTGLPQLVFPVVAAVFGVRSADNPVLVPIIILVALFFSVFFRWLAWMRFHYYVGDYDIRIEKGILSRNARSIPYERIQDVSLEQKPLARIMGLAEVKFETGGGAGEDAKLSFVAVAEAERLRELVRVRKSGTEIADEADDDAAETPPVFAMNARRVFILGLFSFSLFIFAVLGGAAQQLDFLLPFDFWDLSAWVGIAEERGVNVDRINGVSLAARMILTSVALAALLFIGFASGVFRTTLREYGFRLDRTAKGFRRRRGLLTLTDVVMPIHRVQAAIIQTGPLRKIWGWHALKFVSLAQDSKEESNYVAAPLATLDEIWPIATAAMIDAPDTGIAFRKGEGGWWLSGFVGLALLVFVVMASIMVFAEAPLRQAANVLWLLLPFGFLIWFNRRNYRDAIDDRQLYVRNGWWQQNLTIAPQIKLQTIEISQGPIARRQGLASLRFGISGGELEMVALPIATARAIRDAILERVTAVDYSAINRPL